MLYLEQLVVVANLDAPRSNKDDLFWLLSQSEHDFALVELLRLQLSEDANDKFLVVLAHHEGLLAEQQLVQYVVTQLILLHNVDGIEGVR